MGKKVHPGGPSAPSASHGGPLGIPVTVVAKVGEAQKKNGRSSTDIRFSSNKVSVSDDSRSGDFDFDFVYGTEAKYADLMERSVAPLVKAIVEGVSVSMLFVGSCTSEKALYVEKLLPLTIQDIFSRLEKQNKGKRASVYHVKLRAYEIFDEVIQDLFNAENRDLRISHDAVEGYTVAKTSVRGPYKVVDDVLDTLVDSFNSRTSAMSDFGPASKHTSTVWQIDLTQQTREAPGAPVATLRSRLMFVEVAGTEKLCEEKTVIRAREGPTLSKSVLTLQTIGEAYARKEHDYAVYSESKLTQLLEDSLTGNSITLCVASLRQGESEFSLATAQLGQLLRRGMTYPTINDERTQGLVRHYRLKINRLRDELMVASSLSKNKNGGDGLGGGDGDAVQELTIKVNELEGRIVRDNLEKLKMKEEREKIYGKLVEFREKYNNLVEQKSQLQSSTIKGEEEKLKISKALLDLRIENNKLIERCEAEKYELVTKLLNAENEVLQYEMKEETREKTQTALNAQLSEAQKVADEYKLDLIQLKEDYLKIENQFKQELSKNEELGVELLTLVNQKNSLVQEAEELRKERTKLLDDSKMLEERQCHLISEKASLEESLGAERKTNEQLRAEKMKIELELQRKQVEFETQKLDLEKSASDVNRERESEITQLKNKLEGELKRNESHRESLEAEIKELKQSFRLSTRRIRELEQQLNEKIEELSSTKAENSQLAEKVSGLTEGYRGKLMELMNPSDDASEEGHDPEDAAEKEREILQKELIQTFKNKEMELEKKIKSMQQVNQKIVEKNRQLLSRYIACRNRLEDMEVDADKVEVLGSPTSPQQQQQQQDDEHLYKVDSSQIEDQLRQDVAGLKERLDRSIQDLQDAQEKNIRLAASVKRASREHEVRVSELQAEIKMLERQKMNLEEENHALSTRGNNMNSTVDQETTKRMQEVQNALLQKIDELRQMNPGNNNNNNGFGGGSMDGQRVMELERQNRDLQQQLEQARRESEKRKYSSPFPSSARDEDEIRRLKEENKKLRELYAQKGSARRGSGIPNEPEANGKQYADLLTRATVAEEELANYKTYMKKALAKSQMEIKQLKSEVEEWKKKAGAM